MANFVFEYRAHMSTVIEICVHTITMAKEFLSYLLTYLTVTGPNMTGALPDAISNSYRYSYHSGGCYQGTTNIQ